MSQIASRLTQNGDEDDFLYKELSYRVRGALFKVWKALGPAFKENAYHRALAKEFKNLGLAFVGEKRIDIRYEGEVVGQYRPDFVVEEKIILEIKVLPYLTKREEKQLWYYLKGSAYKVALLANFGGRKLEIKRWIYDKAREKYK